MFKKLMTVMFALFLLSPLCYAGTPYPTDNPTVVNVSPALGFTGLSSFSETLGAGNQGSVKYQISNNGTNWYYWNGSIWVAATDSYDHSNTATEVNTNCAQFDDDVGGGNFYFKAFLHSDGTQQVELDEVTLGYVTNQAPNAPTNSSPANGATGQDLNITLTGFAYSDPESDPHTDTQWQVDDDSGFATPVWTRTASAGEITINVTSSTGTFANELAGKTELDHNTTYYWQVRYSDGQWSSWSTATNFTTNLINTPTNSSPANGATVTTLTPLLEASAFSDDQTGHTHAASQWQVDDNSDFSSVTYDSGETASGETSRAVPSGNLNNFTTYYWHVQYKDSSGFWSEYSTSTNFEISIMATAIKVLPVFGNTTVDQGDTVKIDTQVLNFSDGSPLNSATVTINIYNPSGTKVVDGASMTYISGSNGIYRYSYTVPSTSGSYLYEVTATQASKTGYGAANFEVRTIASDISSAKSTVESEQTAQTAERSSQEAERTSQAAERTSQTAERTAQKESRTKVEDIQTRVTAVQSDVSTIKSDVSSAKSTIESAWSRLQTLSGTLPSDYTGVYEQLVSITNTLAGLGVLKGSGAESLYSLSAESKDDVKYLKNKILDMQAAIEINRILLASGGQNSVFSTWYTFHSVVLNMLIANPTDRKAKIPFKAYLPKEAKQEHVISSGGLKIEYDEAAGSYVALGEFELEGGESITRKVEMKDIWLIDETEVGELKRQAEELADGAKKTAYSGQAAVLKNDSLSRIERILRKQKDATATPQDHILAFRENQEDLAVVKENLKKMTDLITSAGAGRGLLASVAGINTFVAWGIIIALVTGIGLLGFMFFSMWKHQMMIAAQMAGKGINQGITSEAPLKAGRGDPEGLLRGGGIGGLALFSLPKIDWRKVLPLIKKILLVGIIGLVVFGLVKGIIYFKPWEKLRKQEHPAVMAPELEKEATPSPSPSPTPEPKKVIILETETGWLNVREGPGISFDKMTRVDVGEEFIELDRETNEAGEEWVKIQIDEETVGWVLGKYVKSEK